MSGSGAPDLIALVALCGRAAVCVDALDAAVRARCELLRAIGAHVSAARFRSILAADAERISAVEFAMTLRNVDKGMTDAEFAAILFADALCEERRIALLAVLHEVGAASPLLHAVADGITGCNC